MDQVEASGENDGLLNRTGAQYRVVVYDASGRCPEEYKEAQEAPAGGEGWVPLTGEGNDWSGNRDYFRKIM